MIFEPHTITGTGAGSNQSGLRDQNARVVLSLIRRHKELASAEIARQSGLTAQTVSNIIRALEAQGLITRGEAVKGKVGKPSTPVALNPGGVLSLGLNIGRRAAELVLVDFTGARLDMRATTYSYPEIDSVLRFVEQGMAEIFAAHPGAQARVIGIGISSPNQIWDWLEIVGAPEDAMRKWRDIDIGAAVSTLTGYESFMGNDATSACVAEHLVGRGREFSDFGYFFIGAFVGGGLVLNDKVMPGRTGYGAALGPLPVPDGQGGTRQLLTVASLYLLEDSLTARGIDPAGLRAQPNDWSDYRESVEKWVKTTSRYLAIGAAAISSVVEIEAILIDGAMPRDVRAELTAMTARHFATLDLTGINPPRIEEAAVGRNARSIGAALLPIHATYFLA